jgi:acetyl/propionyl-CoA carboxylase alpha subunit
VTGLNLIKMQFDVAAGKPLALKQSDVTITGHAIEARLCAEDPADGFKPQSGPFGLFSMSKTVAESAGDIRLAFENGGEIRRTVPSRTGARVDEGVAAYGKISGDYDSMIAKIITKGASREEARLKLIDALNDYAVMGVRTNRRYLVDLLKRDAVIDNCVDIAWLSREPAYTDTNLDGPAAKIAALSFGHSGWRSNSVGRVIVKLRERDAVRMYVVENGVIGGMRLAEPNLARRTWTASDSLRGHSYMVLTDTDLNVLVDGRGTPRWQPPPPNLPVARPAGRT